MAEQLDVILQLEIAQFTASLQQAAQMVTAFANAITGSIGATAQSFQQQVKQINEIVTVTKQAAQTKKDTAKDESDFQKYIDDLRLENWKRHQQFKAQIAKEDAATAKQAAVDDMAQEKAVGEFIMRQHAERVAQEKKNADAIVRIWAEAEAEKAALQIKAQQRGVLRQEVGNLQAGAAIRDIQGQGMMDPQVLFRLQQYNGIIALASQHTTFFDAALARVGTSLKTLGGYFAASFIIGIPFAIAAWAKEAVNVSMQLEDTRLAFTAILGSAKAAGDTLQFLWQTAQRAGVVFTDTADSFRRLAAAAKNTSLEGEGIQKTFENIVVGARVMGVSSAETTRALIAVEQMLTKGRLSAEEYRRQLGNSIPGALKLMAEGMSVTTQTMERMVKSGLIPADAAVLALAKSMGALGDTSINDPLDRLSSVFVRLTNEGTAWMDAIGGWIGDKLKPFLEITIKISAALRELLSLGPLGTTAGGSSAATSPYDEAIQRYARQAGIDAQMFRNLIGAESGFNPEARGPLIRQGGNAGQRALGLGQLMPSTAQDYGLNTYADILNPENNLRVSAQYLADLIQRLTKTFGTLDEKVQLAAAAYNAGIGHVEDAIRTLKEQGKAITTANVVSLLPQPGQTGPYLDRIFGTLGSSSKAGGAAVVDPMDALIKGIERTLTELPKIEAEMDRVAKSSLNFGGILGGEVVKQAKHVTDEFVKTAELLAAFPDLYNKLTPAQKEQLDLAAKQVAVMNERVRDEAQRPADAARAVAAMKKLVEAEEKFNADRADATEQLRLKTVAQEEGTLAAKFVKMEEEVVAARKKGVEEVAIERFVAAETTRIYAETYKEFVKVDAGKLAAVKARVGEQEDLEQLVTDLEAKATKTSLDDFYAAQNAKRIKLEEGVRAGLIGMETLNEFEGAVARAAGRITQEETDKAAKEAAKPWHELANTIESTLAGAFENILRGSKNIFEGIRDAFLKLLAKLAADAITNAVIIPILLKLVGSAGFGGGGTGGVGSLGTLAVGGQGIPGQGGGSAGTSLLGSGLTLASAGNSISGALGGPSLGLGTGGIGATLAATELGRLPLVGSWFGGPGAGAAGPTTGAGSATLGGLFNTAAIGIAVGEILSMLNKLIGFKGTGSAVAAGAGGGAAAGAFAGTYVFPVIGTGIGAAIGTAVGALGGYLSTLFGKDKTPQFDIKGVQPGRIAYDDVVGLQMTQNFKVLADMHKRLGTDYEDFLKAIDDSINQMFEQVVGQIKGATPEVQRALVDPMNAAFESVAAQITNYPQIGGEKFKDQLEVMIRDFAKIFEQTTSAGVKELTDAVAKIDPVVKAFTQIIDGLLQDIQELQKQQKALDDTLAQSLKNLREKSMTPAEILSTRQNEFTDLVAKFNAGDEAAKIQLAPQIASLAEAILDLSTNVFNAQNSFGDLTGIQGAIKQLQESLYTPAQTMAARQTDLANLMDQFRSGDIGVRTVLTPQITQLALQILELAKGVNTLAEQQALLQDFPAQLRSITEALFSPAQTYLSQRSQLTALMAEFRAASPERQLTLEPQVAQLASQILQLARGQDVLGQDPQLLRNTQSELLAAVQEVQDTIANQASQGGSDAAQLQAALERTQAEMIATLREVEYTMAGSIAQNGQQTIQAMWQTAGQITAMDYTMSNGVITAQYYTANGVIGAQYTSAGQLIGTQYAVGGQVIGSTNNVANTVAGWSNYLVYMQNLLIGQVASVRDSAWYSYTVLQQALWTEVGLAQQQIGLLINSLYHLETVDAVVANALGVLGQMNARLGNPLRVDLAGSIGEQLQRDTLTTTQQLLYSQRMGTAATIGMLARIAFGLSFEQGLGIGFQYTAYQHGTRSVPFNMMGYLHRGEQVVPEWEARNGGGGKTIQIHVYGGSKDAGEIADAVIAQIEKKSGRLQSTSIQTTRRR